jgi:hypothetical protein
MQGYREMGLAGGVKNFGLGLDGHWAEYKGVQRQNQTGTHEQLF